MIQQCKNCKPHDFQDKLYGKNMRVHNRMKADGKFRCTVCGVANTSFVAVKETEKKDDKSS